MKRNENIIKKFCSNFFRKALRFDLKVDLSNYAAKADITNVPHVDTSRCARKTNLASLKTEAEKLDINKLVPVPVDFSKLNDVLKSDAEKLCMIN